MREPCSVQTMSHNKALVHINNANHSIVYTSRGLPGLSGGDKRSVFVWKLRVVCAELLTRICELSEDNPTVGSLWKLAICASLWVTFFPSEIAAVIMECISQKHFIKLLHKFTKTEIFVFYNSKLNNLYFFQFSPKCLQCGMFVTCLCWGW